MTSIPTELRELLERIVAGDVGRMIYAKLATGQATETDDGKAWLELRALLATPPADAADMGGQAGEEVEVVRGEDTVFGRQYVRLDRHRRVLAQHRQQAGKLAEALGRGLGAGRGTSGRIIIDAEHEQAMREALADWEKTSCVKLNDT